MRRNLVVLSVLSLFLLPAIVEAQCDKCKVSVPVEVQVRPEVSVSPQVAAPVQQYQPPVVYRQAPRSVMVEPEWTEDEVRLAVRLYVLTHYKVRRGPLGIFTFVRPRRINDPSLDIWERFVDSQDDDDDILNARRFRR